MGSSSWWSNYVRGVRDRYRLLMTPAHPGFALPWLAYGLFVAVMLRWQIDAFLLAAMHLRHCVSAGAARLENEVEWLPLVMLVSVGIMCVTLLPKQKDYARAIPRWVAETAVTLVPVSLIMTCTGLVVFWNAMRAACS